MLKMISLFIASLLAITLSLESPIHAEDWPAFRGPNGDGISLEKNFPVSWDNKKNITWRIPLEGTGNGSPIVVGDTIFLTVATNQGQKRSLLALDRKNGKLKWRKDVKVNGVKLTHKTNPYAGSTPASNGEVVIVWNASGGLHCYGMNGEKKWSKDFGEIRHIWGYGTSPVIVGNQVLLHSGPYEKQFLGLFNISDGSEAWKHVEPGGTTNENGKQYIGSWCTPVVSDVEGEVLIYCGMPTRIVAFRLKDGSEKWFCKGITSKRGHSLVYASPSLSEEVCVVMGGFKGPAIGVKLGGQGDVTESHQLWKDEKANPQRIGSGIVIDGKLYLANADAGSVQCIDMKSGKSLWRGRLPGGAHWGSTVLAGGNLYSTNQTGITNVFEPSEKGLKIISKNEIGEPSNSTPAFSDGQIFLRTAKALYCIGK